MDDFIVTRLDAMSLPYQGGNRAGYCARGMREFCERHNLSYLAFAQHGIPASVLLATGDAMAARLVNHARQRRLEDAG